MIFDTRDYLVIWALNTTYLEDKQQSINGGGSDKHFRIQLIKPPYNSNRNLFLQSGLFTMWRDEYNEVNNSTSQKLDLNCKLPFDQQITNYFEDEYFSKYKYDYYRRPFLRKFMIKKREILQAYRYLEKMNYLGSRHFEGYDGVSKELCEVEFFKSLRKHNF
jgi:hypothetical protein